MPVSVFFISVYRILFLQAKITQLSEEFIVATVTAQNQNILKSWWIVPEIAMNTLYITSGALHTKKQATTNKHDDFPLVTGIGFVVQCVCPSFSPCDQENSAVHEK